MFLGSHFEFFLLPSRFLKQELKLKARENFLELTLSV